MKQTLVQGQGGLSTARERKKYERQNDNGREAGKKRV